MTDTKKYSSRNSNLVIRSSLYKLALIILVLVFAQPAESVYRFGNLIEPGKTTKEDVNKVYGEPVEEIDSTTYRYESTTAGIDGYVIEYEEEDSSFIVERIDIMNSQPYRSQTLAKKMGFPEPTFSGVNTSGKFQEYFGDRFSVVFTHKSSSLKSGVVTISSMTRERFESLKEEVKDSLKDPDTVKVKREKKKEKKETKGTDEADGSGKDDKKPEQTEVAKLTPEAELHLQQGMTYVSIAKASPNTASENYSNALIEFSNAIKAYPNYAEAYSNRGVVYMQQKKYNKAELDLKKAAELKPKDPIIHYNLAALYSLQKKTDLALDSLDKSLDYGFNNFDTLKPKGNDSDPDLNYIRKDPGFKKTLEKHKVFILD